MTVSEFREGGSVEDDRDREKLAADEGEDVEGHKLEPTEGEKDVEGHKL